MDRATQNGSQVVDSGSPAKIVVSVSFQGRKESIARGGRVGNKGEDEERDETMEVRVYLCGGGAGDIRDTIVPFFRESILGDSCSSFILIANHLKVRCQAMKTKITITSRFSSNNSFGSDNYWW